MVSLIKRESRLRCGILAFILLFITILIHGCQDTQVGEAPHPPLLRNPIKIDAGYVSGAMIGSPEKPVRIYRSIPYAAAPVGELRWKPPQPVAPWESIRETTRFRPMAAQRFPNYLSAIEVDTSPDMSEDCLYLNVLTPAKYTTDRLPVMVWFHGGGLDIFSGNQSRYNSPELPQAGVVLVTVGHRLGPFGYLAHPWLSEESPNKVSGNYGQLDLIAALEWIQRNIASFGGDPNCVTIFGQSGGGRKVNFMMVSPIVPEELFHRAISLSSSISSISREKAEKNGLALSDVLEVKSLAEFRNTPWQDIIKATGEIRFFGQFVEDGWSLLEPIAQSFRDGDQKDVPYMIGMVASENEMHFKIPIDLLLNMKQHNSPVYAYVFKAVPTGWKKDGVAGWHSIDIAYLFDELEAYFYENRELEYYKAFLETRGAKSMDPGITDVDRQLAEKMKKIWAQFAATGDPSIDGVVNWPPYKPDTDCYLEFDLPLKVKSGFSKLAQEEQKE